MLAEKLYATLVRVTDPFPGLRPFESDEEPIFRGRQQHTDELLRRLAKHQFLAVVGTSGSGKSSLVRAGLLPALDRGYLAGASSRWRIAVMRPGMAPIDNLAEALRDEEALRGADAEKLRSSSLGLVEAVRQANLPAGESLLVVADQFEELFRYRRRMEEIDGGAEAALFVNLLLTAARRPDTPVYVVLTMRSDFLGDCAQFPGLPEALSESQYLIPRLTRDQRRRAIEEPLRLFGASITPQLVEQLLNDSGDEITESAASSRYRGGAADPLPVLQHALMRTYLEWKSGPPEKVAERIDLADYRKAGCMASALDQHAERLFTKELDDAGRRWAQRIFRCLTTTEFGRPVRRPAQLIDLYRVIGAHAADRAKVGEVLELYRRRENSFLQVSRDTSVDISHESLIWKWKRLGGWVAKEAASAELYRDLVKDAQGEATWGEPKLSSALAVRNADAWNEHWARQYSEQSFSDVESFLERSRKAVRNQRLIRWFGLAAAVAVVILLAVSSYLLEQRAALQVVQVGQAKELQLSKEKEQELVDRIAGLNTIQSSTKEERARVAKEKSDLEAQLKKSQDESQKLTGQIQNQSTDLLATVKSLQSRLDAALRQRDDAVQARDDALKRVAEGQPAQVQARVIPPTKSSEGTGTTEKAPSPRILRPESAVSGVAWSPDGRTLASVSEDRTIRLWEAASGKVLRTFEKSSSSIVAWSPDGKTLASGTYSNTVLLWEVASGKLLRILEGHRNSVNSVVWSPDGRTLASGGEDREIRLWDAASGKLVRAIQAQTIIYSVAWSPDGKTLASGGQDDTTRLWDAVSGKLVRTIQAQSIIFSVAWSPDGQTLASGSGDGTIRLWKADGRQVVRTMEGHEVKVTGVAWRPDGKMLASGSDDQTIRLWDAASGRPLQALQGHQGAVRSLAWSPDGKTLASGSSDKTVRFWDVAVALK